MALSATSRPLWTTAVDELPAGAATADEPAMSGDLEGLGEEDVASEGALINVASGLCLRWVR